MHNINECSNKCVPDGIPPIILRKNWKTSSSVSTHVHQHVSPSVKNSAIVWKTAHVISVPKPGKSADLSTSSRPISQTPLNWRIKNMVLGNSIALSLLCISSKIKSAGNQKRPFRQQHHILEALDLSNTFDTAYTRYRFRYSRRC